MKLTATTLLAITVPSLCSVSGSSPYQAGLSWKFQEFPVGGLSDVTFGFNMANAPHKSGYYFAQEFTFKNVSQIKSDVGYPTVGYTGVQPRPDSNGKSIVHAAFSSFITGTTTSHKNCNSGADKSKYGVSCAVEIQGDYTHTYNTTVENIGGTAWRGSLIDTVTGTSTVIGEWTLPSVAGLITNGYAGFLEYYPWNGNPVHNCSTVPRTEITFFDPSSKTRGAGGGQLSVFPNGECVGKVAYNATKVPGGYNIKVGF